MSSVDQKNFGEFIQALGDETKHELLVHLADELGYDLTEQGDPVDPQADILDVLERAIRSLQKDLSTLQAQFAEGAQLDYTELDRAAHSIDDVVAELAEAYENLHSVIEMEFDVDDYEDEDDEDEDEDEDEEGR